MSFVKPTNIIPHTSDDTRCHHNLLNLLITLFRLNKHNLCTSFAAPKAKPIFHAANKNLFIKIYFDLRYIIFFIILPLFTQQSFSEGPHKLRQEVTKHTHCTLFLATNNFTLANITPTKISSYNNPTPPFSKRTIDFVFLLNIMIALTIYSGKPYPRIVFCFSHRIESNTPLHYAY